MPDQPSTDSPTVLLADDHTLFRNGLQRLLERNQLRVIGQASTGVEAVDIALRMHPDVVLMDVRMPGMDGIEAARRIRSQLPSTSVVMVSGFDDKDMLVSAIMAGALSYVTKAEDPHKILQAIQSTRGGGASLPAQAFQELLGRLSNPQPGLEYGRRTGRELSAREVEILRLLAHGMRGPQIAERLQLSVRTVHNHLNRVYAKLHVRNRLEAVRSAIAAGIVKVS